VRRSDETVEALAHRPCLICSSSFISSFSSSVSGLTGSRAQCYGFELSSLCLPPLSLYLSTGFSLWAGRCPVGIWLHRCGLSVKEEGCARFKPLCENASFPYTWQLDTLHITDLLSDIEYVTLCCVL